ncbi:MAG: AMP-binding protein [Gammaproteobacteria bacterium]|nr:AMP-binding protein [Gammaproteobacteria bacterium]
MTQNSEHSDDTPAHVGLHAAHTPNRAAIIMAETGQRVTFAQYEALSNRCAHLARSLGLKRGDNMAVFMPNHPWYLPLVWGGMRAGLRVTTIATHLAAAEVDHILADCGARMLIGAASRAEILGEVRMAGVPAAARLMLDGREHESLGFHDLEAALHEQPDTPIADQSEGVEMLYSSGTTGVPKGIRKPLPDQPFGHPNPAHRRIMAMYGIDRTSVYLSPAPLYHAAPLSFNLRAHRFGATTVIMQRFDPQLALQCIERHRVTHSQWVPTMFVRMLRLPQAIRERYDLSSHCCAIHAAAPCPREVKHAMIDWWGPIVREYYGGSEGNGMTALDSHQWLTHPGSVGRAIVGEIRICDERGSVLPPHRTGTVYFANGNPFEYHNDPAKTAASRHPQGWTTLGDIGHVDEDGYLYLTDRHAHVIISGGVNIYPQEAENRLLTHPKVMDAAVIGVPDEEFGEAVKAVVQPLNPSDAGDELARELIDYCRGAMSHVKCPRSVDFVDSLPRQENGKLYKRLLRERYWPR